MFPIYEISAAPHLPHPLKPFASGRHSRRSQPEFRAKSKSRLSTARSVALTPLILVALSPASSIARLQDSSAPDR